MKSSLGEDDQPNRINTYPSFQIPGQVASLHENDLGFWYIWIWMVDPNPQGPSFLPAPSSRGAVLKP